MMKGVGSFVQAHVADRRICEASSLGGLFPAVRQARDAVSQKTSVKAGSCELRNAVPQATEHIVERKQRPPTELDDHCFLDRREHGALWIARAHGRIRGGCPRPPFGKRHVERASVREKSATKGFTAW